MRGGADLVSLSSRQSVIITNKDDSEDGEQHDGSALFGG